MHDVRFTDAKIADGWLCLKPDNMPLARRVVASVKQDTNYTAKIHKTRQKRSLDANAYFWVLVDKLAEVTGQPVSDIYYNLVRDVGGNSYIVPVKESAADHFIAIWQKNRLGWVCDHLGACRNTPGYVNIKCYYGSSVYDTAQMSRLIDLAVQECQQQDIETLPPDKLNALKIDWKGGTE